MCNGTLITMRHFSRVNRKFNGRLVFVKKSSKCVITKLESLSLLKKPLKIKIFSEFLIFLKIGTLSTK